MKVWFLDFYYRNSYIEYYYFFSNARTILILPILLSQIVFYPLPLFFVGRLISNSTSINIKFILKFYFKPSIRFFFKRILAIPEYSSTKPRIKLN